MESMETMEELLAMNAGMNMLPFMFSLALYVLSALGLYTIAKRRNIGNPWLAWIPFGNSWILGSISDQYQYSVKKKKTGRRKLLLGLEIATSVAAVILVIAVIGMAFDMFVELGVEGAYSDPEAVDEATLVMSMLQYFGKVLGTASLISVISIVYTVFAYMCYYDLYRSCNPDNAVLYLVLSIVFKFLGSIFVFLCRDSDQGMQPEPQQADPWQYPPQELPVNPTPSAQQPAQEQPQPEPQTQVQEEPVESQMEDPDQISAKPEETE